jgi:CubicO group peptidase (beta-lactamase class C family)
MRLQTLVLLSVLCNTTGICFAQPLLSASQRYRLDSIASQDVPKNAPGVACAIMINGKTVYEKLVGYANLADSTLITRNSRFNIASNGKQFTALAILKLMEEKKITGSQDIRKYLPSLFPTSKQPVTIRQLLTHSSGIRDVYDLWSLQGITWWKRSFNNSDVLRLLEKQQDLNFEPGTKYQYSNSNYILLAMLVEKITGRSFVAYTNEMFQQLNMPHTSFEDDYKKIKGPIAKAYFNFDTWKTYDWIWNVVGDGNIFSTLADQLQWEKIVQGMAASKVKPAIIKKSQQLVADAGISNYGYGLEFGQYKNQSYTFHEGATGAWKATVLRFPASNTSMLTLTNTGKATPNTQTRQMADVLFNFKSDAGDWLTTPTTPGVYISDDEITGTYQDEYNFTFQFEKRDSTLYLLRMGRNDVKLTREAANIFQQTYDPAFKQEFKRNETGEMTVTAYYTSHAPYTLTRANSNWTGFDPPSLNGKFINAETDVSMEIKYAGGKNYDIKFSTKDSIRGLLISPQKLLVNNYVLDMESSKGAVQTIRLSGNRISQVKFTRIF